MLMQALLTTSTLHPLSFPHTRCGYRAPPRVSPRLRAGTSMAGNEADNDREEAAPLLQHRLSTGSALSIEHDGQPRGSQPGFEPASDCYATAQYSLMASYALAAWAWRSWEFAVALLLIYLYPDSLLMVSAYGITDNIVRVVLGSRVGKFISKHQLVTGATSMYLAQNACIGVSAMCAMALLTFQPEQPQVYWPLIAVMILVGALSSVGSSGVRIAVEAEAVTALGDGNSSRLSQLNAGFRAIDLSCLLLAPLLVGCVMTWVGPPAATLLLGGYTLLAWIPEISLLRLAVSRSTSLREFKNLQQTVSESGAGTEGEAGGRENGDAEAAVPSSSSHQQQEALPLQSQPKPKSSWSVYLHHPVLLPNLALAVLYCTVLSLGFLMTGYLQWSGLTSAEVSMYRGVGALTGLAATVLFPIIRPALGLVTTGALGILYQLFCLTVGVVPVALVALGQPGGPGAFQPSAGLVRVLVGGVVASRTGLWMYDLALTQLIQERVPKKDISVVCGVQSSLQACFEMLSFLAGVYLHDPRLFYWLMLGSLGVVTTAASLYMKFAISQSCGREGSSVVTQS